jgi:flagellar biosynthesis chaperone FliJ
MDKLREKRAAEYRRETLAGETKILDDLASRNTAVPDRAFTNA